MSDENLPRSWCPEKWLVRFAVDCEKPLERFTCRSRSLVTRASSSTAFDTARCAASMLGRWFIAHAT